jgi:hypothetical protein
MYCEWFLRGKKAATDSSQDTACFEFFLAACVKNRKSIFGVIFACGDPKMYEYTSSGRLAQSKPRVIVVRHIVCFAKDVDILSFLSRLA